MPNVPPLVYHAHLSFILLQQFNKINCYFKTKRKNICAHNRSSCCRVYKRARVLMMTCLAGDLVFHMFEEQALLLRYELHLHRVQRQQPVQRLGHPQHVLLGLLLHPPWRSQLPRLPELKLRLLCGAQNPKMVTSKCCCHLEINQEWRQTGPDVWNSAV